MIHFANLFLLLFSISIAHTGADHTIHLPVLWRTRVDLVRPLWEPWGHATMLTTCSIQIRSSLTENVCRFADSK